MSGLPLALWGIFPNLPPIARFEPVLAPPPRSRHERAEELRRLADEIERGRR